MGGRDTLVWSFLGSALSGWLSYLVVALAYQHDARVGDVILR